MVYMALHFIFIRQEAGEPLAARTVPAAAHQGHYPLAATRASDPWLDQKRNEYDSPRPVTREWQTVHAPSIGLRAQHVGGASQTADNAHEDWKTQPKFAPSGYEGSPQRLVATKRTCKKDTCV